MTNEHVGDFDATSDIWLGSIPSNLAAVWVDYVVAQVHMTRLNLSTLCKQNYLHDLTPTLIFHTKYQSTGVKILVGRSHQEEL